MPETPLAADVLKQLNQSVDQPHIKWSHVGSLLKKGWWNRRKFNLLSSKETKLLAIIQALSPSLAHLERKGVKYFDPRVASEVEAHQKYCQRFSVYFSLADAIRKQVHTLHHSSARFRQAYCRLEAGIVGLSYSLGKTNGGMDPLQSPDPSYLAQLKTMAAIWKSKQPLAVRKELNDLDIQQLQEAAKYPEWCRLFLQNPMYQREFFNWALRDYNFVRVFIECPHTQQKLKEALLSAHLGYIRRSVDGEEVLAFEQKIVRPGVMKRELTLCTYNGRFDQFEADQQKRLNVLKPEKQFVTFTHSQGSDTVSLQEIFNDHAQNNLKNTKFPLTPWGFTMPMELKKQNWTQCVPPSRIVYDQDLRKQYGQQLEGKSVFFKLRATRSISDQGHALYALGSHGFWEIYIRMGKDKWRVLAVGVYAHRFQQNLWDGLSLFCATVKRVFSFLDQNVYYTHRQRAAYSLFPSPEKAQEYLDRLYDTLVKASVFQFPGKNCTQPIQKVTEKTLRDTPNLFSLPVSRVYVKFKPIDLYLALLDKCPTKVRNCGIHLLQTLLWGFRKLEIERGGRKKWYSVKKYYKTKAKGQMYHPAYLPYQIERAHKTGKGPFAQGELSWGNTDTI